MNRKSMIFTLFAIVLLSLFLISFSVYSITQNNKILNQRIKTLNDFVFSVEEDIPRQLYISSFRIIFLFEKRITETGVYIIDLNETFQEAFYNGTIYGVQENLMQGVTFSDNLNALKGIGRKINADVDFSHQKISIKQDDPWHINVTLEGDLLIKDKNNLVSWNRSFTTSTSVSVENFEDPLYTIHTNSLVVNKINKSLYQPFVNGNDVTHLQKHVEHSFYINSTLAPSFLDRIQGKKSPNAQGIESLIYLPALSGQGIETQTKSVVDYIYFSGNNPTSYTIQGMPSWFRIDDAHLAVYGVGNLTS